MITAPWKLRSAQIDARSIQPMEYFKYFIDFIHDYGYNTLTLYLEGMIRTKSFPYRAPQESYTPGQMRELVDYAGKRGIEIIPVISALGHAQMYLEQKELRHLAELREGIMGRFYEDLMVLCPSLTETYDFLEAYFTEIAEIFPSQYFHVGCDESWEIGYCSLCRKRIQNGEKEAGLFGKHILRAHEIVSGKLSKRMLMWDDMLELYPEALDLLPKDIIMCVWQYHNPVNATQNHFGPWHWDERLGEYDKLGFKYLIATRELHARNIESFTRYARAYKPLGGLVTSWECRTNLMIEDYPNIAFAGRLWNDPGTEDSEALFKQTNAELFGLDDPVFLHLIRTAKSLGSWPWHEKKDPEQFLRGPVSPYQFERANMARVLDDGLRVFKSKVTTDIGRDVLESILLSLGREQLQHDLRILAEDIYTYWGHDKKRISLLLDRGQDILERIAGIKEQISAQWQRWRPGIKPEYPAIWYDEFYRNISCFLEEVRTGKRPMGLLSVSYSPLNLFSGLRTTWSIQYEGESAWETVHKGSPTPDSSDYSESLVYSIESPIRGDKIPSRLRIETSGYGPCRVRFVSASNTQGCFTPSAVENIKGCVEAADNLLVNDVNPCLLGEGDAVKAFFQRELTKKTHSVEIVLKAAPSYSEGPRLPAIS